MIRILKSNQVGDSFLLSVWQQSLRITRREFAVSGTLTKNFNDKTSPHPPETNQCLSNRNGRETKCWRASSMVTLHVIHYFIVDSGTPNRWCRTPNDSPHSHRLLVDSLCLSFLWLSLSPRIFLILSICLSLVFLCEAFACYSTF